MRHARRRNGRTGRGLRGRQGARAFTMVELLLVLVILATLAAIVIPKFAGRGEQARVTAAQVEISNLEVALDAFEVDNGYYPKGDEGLTSLMEEPEGARSWHGPYLKKALDVDPWGIPYTYEYPGRNNPRGYDIASAGPDKSMGTPDDITNWKKK